jgi:glycosyltransferase involved in cell wall biosynthesis
MKVLLVCHAFAPGRGSEPGFSWNWATRLSAEHDIWVLAHPEFRPDVEAHLASHPNPRLHVVWLQATAWDPRRGQGGVVWHYLRWLRQAQRLGRSLHAEISFDLVHHLSLSTISAPPAWWKLDIPFVWGPLGGAQLCPSDLLELFGNHRWREWLRPLRLGLLRVYPPFRAAVARSAAILATNHETRRFLGEVASRPVTLFWDSGVEDEVLPPRPARPAQRETMRVLWASRFQKRKALPLALDAMVLLRGAPVTLVVAGGGDEAGAWRALVNTMGIQDRVEFLGELDPPRMHEEFRRADVFLFTSIRDSFGTVVLEAMTHGLPVVALDIHGVAARMPAAAGIKVAAQSRVATAAALASALLALSEDPELRHELGVAAWDYAATQVWSRRVAEMSALYRRVATAVPVPGPATHAPQPGVFIGGSRP